MKIAIIGSGSWGTAMASQLLLKHDDIIMYSQSATLVDEINTHHENKEFLPGVILSEKLQLTTDYKTAVNGADVIVLAVPAKAIQPVINEILPFLGENQLIISVAKGLDDSGERLSVMIEKLVEDKTDRIAVLSGPTHAEEVGLGKPAATVIAAKRKDVAIEAQSIYMLPNFRAYYSTDLVGVEYAGALKNVIALAAGVVDGLGCGDNTRAALITRGLAEIARYVVFFGGRLETLFGLAGMGDLIVTCTSLHSRNYSAGLLLAKGKSAEEALAATNMVVEGIRTVDIVYPIACKYGIDMPITEQIYKVVHGESTPEESIRLLLNRESKEELQEPEWN